MAVAAVNRKNARERILAAAEPLVLGQGFAGTSLDDILKATALTKGAFFHHFKGKADFASALVERYAANHYALFDRLAADAEAHSRDPLDSTMFFLKRFEDFMGALVKPHAGCVFASYTHEHAQFDAPVRAFIAECLKRWSALYEAKFGAVLARYRPRIEVSAAELAEMVVAIIEGGLILSRSFGDSRLVARQARQFRNYLELLFSERTLRVPVTA
jgi:TetR/AcrR family transcriptional regulator, transcriptional repressor for nem operon